MCNCISELEDKLVKEGSYKGKKILRAENQNWALMFNTPSRVFLEIEVEVEGMRKKQIQNVLATYCPFCAEPYDVEQAK